MPQPRPIANVLSDLLARTGYARVRSESDFERVWVEALDPFFKDFCRPGQIKRGVLEVTVANSTMLQELTFQKTKLLAKLQAALPDAKLSDVRLRVGKL